MVFESKPLQECKDFVASEKSYVEARSCNSIFTDGSFQIPIYPPTRLQVAQESVKAVQSAESIKDAHDRRFGLNWERKGWSGISRF